jgi:ubiquinone/menaquinone biosynthesis C-methylase UbiE
VSFDAVAPWYRTLETIAFGNALQRARIACLNEIGSPRRALVVGEGNGRLLRELLTTHPGVQVDCIDASERMLQLAQQRIGQDANRVSFQQRDIMSWTPTAGEYDLIVTHFFLDCFSEDQLSEVVTKLSGAATPNAAWLVADFRIPSQTFAGLHARAWLVTMYSFFRSVAGIDARELVDPSAFLRAEEFSLVSQHLSRYGMLKSELWRRQL